MPELLISYINYEHGGRQHADYSGDGGPYQYEGLVRIMDDGPWPHILVVGEADRWEYNGGQGAWEAAEALREAGGPAYTPLIGSLPREWGPFTPAILVDPTAVVVRRWFDHRCPDFAGRNRNLLVARMADGGPLFRVVAVHGDIHSGDMRLADAKTFDRFANPAVPCAIIGDWNSVPSGPHWEPTDLNSGIYEPWRLAWRIHWQHGPAQAGPHALDTRALDYLCGYWADGRRSGGIGFHDAAELTGVYEPTQIPRPNGRQPMAIDRLLVNGAWKDAVESFRVHQPTDPARPDSDHLRISAVIRV